MSVMGASWRHYTDSCPIDRIVRKFTLMATKAQTTEKLTTELGGKRAPFITSVYDPAQFDSLSTTRDAVSYIAPKR